MNNAILTGVISLALGIGIGWIAKPTGSDPNEPLLISSENRSPGANPEGGGAPPARNSGFATPPPAKSGSRPAAPPDPAMPWNVPEHGEGAFGGIFEPDSRERISKQLQKTHRHQLDTLTTSLQLTDEQQEKLRQGYFQQSLAATLNMFHPIPGAEQIDTPDLGAALGALLTEPQAAAYDSLRQHRQRQEIESETLSTMAELTSLDLTEAQKDAVYEIVHREIEAEYAEDEGGALIGAVGGALLGAVIGNRVGDGDAARGAVIGAATEADPEELQARAEASQREAVEEELAPFRDILTPEQLALLRSQLESDYGILSFDPTDFYLPPLAR